MERYKETENKTFTFSSCDICEAECCNGLKHTTMGELVLNDFEYVAENFPIVFIIGDLGYLKPVILLSNAKGYCRYLKDLKCSIYDKRAPICRTYPLSMDIFNKLQIDMSCPAVNKEGINIVKNGKIDQSFYFHTLENYQEKYIDTHNYFNELNKKENLEHILTLKGIKFFKFIKHKEKKYVDIHLRSLKNLDEYFY